MKSLEYTLNLERNEIIQENIYSWLKLVDDFNQGHKENLKSSLFPHLSSSLTAYFEIEISLTMLNKWKNESTADNIHAYFAVNQKKLHLYLIEEKSDQHGNFAEILPTIESSNYPNGYPLKMSVSGEFVPFHEAHERINRWQNDGENWIQNQQSIFFLMKIPVSDFTQNIPSNPSKTSITFYSYLALKTQGEDNKFELITSDQSIHGLSPTPPPIPPHVMFDLTMPIPPFGNTDPKSNYQLLIASEQ